MILRKTIPIWKLVLAEIFFVSQMRKRGRSLSFDRPRALSSLEEELRQLEEHSESVSSSTAIASEPVVYRALQSREFSGPWLNVDVTTRNIMEINRLKSRAARRQMIADALKCSVVTEHVPGKHDLDALYDFSNDLDSKSVAVISKRTPGDSSFTVETRRESGLETPDTHGIDLGLSSYLDALSSDDLFCQFAYHDDGSPDLSNVSVITKALPWFNEFVETVRLKNVPALSKVFEVVQSSFSVLKEAYVAISRNASGIYAYRWPQVVADRLSILNRNFPKGILGFRALTCPEDPRHIKALIVTQGDKGASQQIFGGMGRANRLTEAEEKEMERETGTESKISKYAPMVDMKRVWTSTLLPRVAYINTNGVAESMAQAEHEHMNDMTAWSVAEVRTFLERLGMHGKNFKRISANLPEKSEKDCVEFYYRFKIHLGMKQIVSAALLNRIERRSDAQSSSATARGLIDQSIAELEAFVGPSGYMSSRKQLEGWNVKNSHQIAASTKVYGKDTDPESPRRERRNAMIDALVSVIGKGHSIPPQLALLVESSAPVTPAISPQPLLVPIPAPPRRASLTLVQTAVTVLQIQPKQEEPTRQLQPHHTI